jgi:hypothetical protein
LHRPRNAELLPQSWSLLTSRADIDDEVYAMRHCVWRYWPWVQAGEFIIGSIRRHGLRKATAEFDDVGEMLQVQGHGNQTVSAEKAEVRGAFSEEIVRLRSRCQRLSAEPAKRRCSGS